MRTPSSATALRLLPLLLAMSVTACATRLPPPPRPAAPAQIPPPPAELMTPPSEGSWSTSAQQLFKQWRQRLTKPKSV